MPKRTKQGATMTELLRAALTEAPSLREVERQTGVKRQSMMKFLRGEQSLRLDIADRLASYFGILIVRANSIRGQRR
jgi:plasmid maintenance system antidote protein VapI